MSRDHASDEDEYPEEVQLLASFREAACAEAAKSGRVEPATEGAPPERAREMASHGYIRRGLHMVCAGGPRRTTVVAGSSYAERARAVLKARGLLEKKTKAEEAVESRHEALWAYLDKCDQCMNEPLVTTLMRAGPHVHAHMARTLRSRSAWLCLEQTKEYQRMRALRVFGAGGAEARGTPQTAPVGPGADESAAATPETVGGGGVPWGGVHEGAPRLLPALPLCPGKVDTSLEHPRLDRVGEDLLDSVPNGSPESVGPGVALGARGVPDRLARRLEGVSRGFRDGLLVG